MAIEYIELSYIVSYVVSYVWSKIMKYSHEKSSKQSMKNRASKAQVFDFKIQLKSFTYSNRDYKLFSTYNI